MLPEVRDPTLGETLLTTGLGTLLVMVSLGDKLDPDLGEVDKPDPASEGLAPLVTAAVLMLGVTGFHPVLF